MTPSRSNSLVLLLSVLLACHRAAGGEAVVVTTLSEALVSPILTAYERQTGGRPRAVLARGRDRDAVSAAAGADVLWTANPVAAVILARRGNVIPFRPLTAESVPAQFRAVDGSWTGGAAQARVLLVNDRRVARGEPPRSVRDLAAPRWAGATAIASPLAGTSAIHFAALATAWGDDGLRAFLDASRANGVRVAPSEAESARLAAAGEVAFALVDSDAAARAAASGAPVSIVYPDQDGIGTLVVPTAVALLRGPHPEAGRRLAENLVSIPVEERLADLGTRVPLRREIDPPAGLRRVGQFRAMEVDYGKIADAMDRLEPWIRDWVGH